MGKTYQSAVVASDFHSETRAFYAGKRVAVTGGSGFIGSHIVEQLLTLNAQPVVLSRQSHPVYLNTIRDKIELIHCDLLDYESTLKSFLGCSIVINVAAVVAGIEYNKNHPASIFQGNLQTFFNAIKAATEQKVERFVVVSTACVYPRYCIIPTPESEGFRDEPEPTNSGYGWSKRMEEYLAKQYKFEFGLSVAIPRPYNAYGPRDNFNPQSSHVIPALILKAFQAQNGLLHVWGDGSHSRSFLYVDDFARGVLEVGARYAEADPLNVGSQEEITIHDIAFLIAEKVGNFRGIKLQPVFDKDGITGQPRRMCDTQKLKEKLNYETIVPFTIGLDKTIKWFGSEYEKNRSLYSHKK